MVKRAHLLNRIGRFSPSARPIPGTVVTASVVAFQRTIARLSSMSKYSGVPRNVLGRAKLCTQKKTFSKKNHGYSFVVSCYFCNISTKAVPALQQMYSTVEPGPARCGFYIML